MIKRFYVVENDKPDLHFSAKQILKDFNQGPMPLIRIYKGLYSLVRKETITNLIEHAKDCEKLNKMQTTRFYFSIFWTEMIDLPQIAGKILVGDDVDE